MHRVKRLVPFVLAASTLGGVPASAGAAESLKLDLSSPANANTDPAAAPVSSSALTAGVKYIVTVDGTGSIWEPSAFNSKGTCGIAETAPKYPSPGKLNSVAAWDAATVFAAPKGSSIGPFGTACSPTVALPMSATSSTASGRHPVAGFEFTADAAYPKLRPVPVGGVRTTPRADHTYQWEVTGTGAPLRFRFADTPSADNSGVLNITVASATECAASNCTANSAPAFDQVPPAGGTNGGSGGTGGTGGAGGSTPTAAKQSIKVKGTRTCKSSPTITVQVSEPDGVDFRKVTYYFSGVKKRVLYRTTKKTSRLLVYTSGKKKGQIKPQKFTGQSIKKQYRLTLLITTTANQNVTVRRTIPACTKSKKTRSFS
ncbi:MAG: hypothetical protein J7513_00370 [Solirubrobacteraceae bacterium]|nr:hypothetical protein [Solirubrobacteraceae bacterium]